MTDPTQVPLYKTIVITENLADGTIETTVFERSKVEARRIDPEPNMMVILDAIVDNRPPPTPPAPRIEISIQPLCDEVTGEWVHQTLTKKDD